MLQGKGTWCSEVLYYGEFYLLCIWGQGHKRVTGEGHHKGREIPQAFMKTEGYQAVQGVGGRAPGHTFRLEWNCWNPENYRGGGGLAALRNLQDLNPDQGLKPEPQQWRPRNPESWMPTTRPTENSPTESFMRTLVRYGWMNCTRESPNPTMFLPPFMVPNTDQRISLW